MARSLADQLAALATRDVTRVATVRASFLPRGTNADRKVDVNLVTATKKRPKISAKRGMERTRYTIGDYYNIQPEHVINPDDVSPEYREGVRRNLLGLPHTVQSEAIRAARKAQSITGQSAGVEAHMSLTKGALHPYKTLEQLGDDNKPDLADTWQRPSKVDVNLKLARLREDQKLRDAIRNSIATGECE
jgi:hypothetical protein